ncbi:hypothetical protein BDV33DRAFT_175472 [Aspergillus novoparasiticus]|uniref:Uncharacterized protein n=1 Tax=Aspergillus novoparasiticus TaxID=986946 RepID=A0A5N6ELL9_9EURO|nr:hypothetical protein BDV33DRAFT_175472 [Aspergillus novoparasiticus]
MVHEVMLILHQKMQWIQLKRERKSIDCYSLILILMEGGGFDWRFLRIPSMTGSMSLFYSFDFSHLVISDYLAFLFYILFFSLAFSLYPRLPR